MMSILFSYYVLVNIVCCRNTGIYINANKNHKHRKRVMLSNIKAKTIKPHKLFLVFIFFV